MRLLPLCGLFATLLLTPFARAATVYEPVGALERGPHHPDRGNLVRHSDGNFYGTAPGGGAFGLGTLYRLTPAGEVSVVLHFTGTAGTVPGSQPFAGLVSDASGLLWGTTQKGGAGDLGTVFKVNPATGAFSTVTTFTGVGGAAPGSYPSAPLVADGAGNWWGTTEDGGASNLGTVFKLNASSGVFSSVVSFTGNTGAARGSLPVAGLVSDGAGFFWGTAKAGGVSGLGTVFKVAMTTGAFTPVVDFTGVAGAAPGSSPLAALAGDGAGALWGTTQAGGAANLGTVFKVATATNVLSSVASFTGISGAAKGSGPTGTLLRDAGFFWGTTQGGGANDLGTVFRINFTSNALTTPVEFTGVAGAARGATPVAGLVSDGAGSLWGTTQVGGVPNIGTAFKVATATGALTTVAEFQQGIPGVNGINPYGSLISDAGGFFWGTTASGGLKDFGTVYKINAATGVVRTVADFTGTTGPGKGRQPLSKLTSDGAGNFWGTTFFGGTSDFGTVFRVNTTTGALTTVSEFTGTFGAAKGRGPVAGLVTDGAGSFWGTTSAGGAGDSGTVFKVNTTSGVFSTVLEFTGVAGAVRGAAPYAELASDGAGVFWGTTSKGGAANVGTVFKVNATTSAFNSLAEFTGMAGATPGAAPLAGLLRDSGFFWGTTAQGGATDNGTVFKVNAGTNVLTNVVQFTGTGGAAPGKLPFAGLMRDASGSFLGTTLQGGVSSLGTIYKLTTSGTFTNLFSFTGIPGNVPGSGPGYGRLLLPTDGNVYGTTLSGGRTVGGGPAGGGQVFRLRITPDPLTPLETWKLAHLGDANAPDLGDPDGDGVLTLDEYGLLLLPETPDSSGLPRAQSFVYSEGRRLRIFFQRDPAHNDVTIEVQATSNLTGPWTVIASSVLGGVTTGAGYFGGDSATPGVKTVEVRDVVNITSAPQRFFRVRVLH